MRLLLIGGSGFLGRNLLRKVPRAWEVHATYRSSESFPGWLDANGLDHVTAVRVDLRDDLAVSAALDSLPAFDACLFMAADTAVRALVENPPQDVRNNILPVANLVRHYRGGRLAYMSSGAVYMGHEGLVSPETMVRPTMPYAIGKYASELYVHSGAEREWYEESTVLRFFGAYGPWEASRKITTKLLEAVHAGEHTFTVFGDGNNYIDVMYVDDAVAGLLAVLSHHGSSGTIDFCVGSPLTLNEFVTRVGEAFDHAFDIRHEGSSPEYIRFSASPDGMAAAFSFRPRIPLEEGMKRFAGWLAASSKGEG